MGEVVERWEREGVRDGRGREGGGVLGKVSLNYSINLVKCTHHVSTAFGKV